MSRALLQSAGSGLTKGRHPNHTAAENDQQAGRERWVIGTFSFGRSQVRDARALPAAGSRPVACIEKEKPEKEKAKAAQQVHSRDAGGEGKL